jgi:hypothetical protein
VISERDVQRGAQTIDEALDEVFAATESALKKLIGAMSVLKMSHPRMSFFRTVIPRCAVSK